MNCYHHFVAVAKGHGKGSSTSVKAYPEDKLPPVLGTHKDTSKKSSRRKRKKART